MGENVTDWKADIGMMARVATALSLLCAPALSQGAPITPAAAAVPAAESEKTAEILTEGKQVERTLTVGEVHNYTVHLAANRSVKLLLEKRGVAAVATVFAPDGKKVGVFGSTTSGQGSEEIAFVTKAAGDYRVALRTFFNPSAPGRYRLTLASMEPLSDEDKFRLAKQSCQEKNWLDSDNNFLVDRALKSISRCLGAVGESLDGKYPTAVELAKEGSRELDYLISRWRWGEFVSPAYQESLTEELRALVGGLERMKAEHVWGALQEVVRDIKVKAAHCRQSNRGLGGDVKVKVVTKREGAEVKEMFVFYKRCLYKYSKSSPNRFGKLTPVSSTLPPSIYIMWAGKNDQPPALRHDPACVPVQGDDEQQIDIPAP